MENFNGSKLSRRKFVQRSVMAGAATALVPGTLHAAKTPVADPAGPNLYEQIGVRPLVNAKGTYTITVTGQDSTTATITTTTTFTLVID